MRSVLTPHECQWPVETAVNVPVGAVACPYSSAPQQATVRPVLTPQECPSPTETERNCIGIQDQPGRAAAIHSSARSRFPGSSLLWISRVNAEH